jgi:hypothetical protein
MWCVVADNGDEFWAYGPFESYVEAGEFASKMNDSHDGKIFYWPANFYDPKSD